MIPTLPYSKSNEHVRFGGAVQFGWLSNDFGPADHIGHPTGASADAGKVLFEDAIRVVCNQRREIAAFELSDARDDAHQGGCQLASSSWSTRRIPFRLTTTRAAPQVRSSSVGARR